MPTEPSKRQLLEVNRLFQSGILNDRVLKTEFAFFLSVQVMANGTLLFS